jgi:NDP-sugar pyrophosphorylase family protein
MLLAAGLGTRLGDLSDERPKPMLPVCDRPLVRWAAQLCVHHGITDLVVNLHHLGEQIRRELGGGEDLGAEIRYSPEPVILGTGGGIKAMAALRPRGTCIVVNAKIVVDLDLEEVLAAHRRRGALATLVLKADPDAERWGAIGIDRDGRLTRLLDLQRPGDGPSRDCMFTGIHVLEPEIMDAIPEGPCCIVRTAYSTLFSRGAPLFGHVHPGYFHEHSTPARYLRGNFNLLDGVVDPAARPGPLRGVDPLAEVHPTARLIPPVLLGPRACIEAGAVLGPRAVVGAGARVARGVRLAESVVWPETEVTEDTRRAILTPRKKIAVEEAPPPGTPAPGLRDEGA